MDDDELRFKHETEREAAYWFTVSDFADLSLDYDLDRMLMDMLQLRKKYLQEQS